LYFSCDGGHSGEFLYLCIHLIQSAKKGKEISIRDLREAMKKVKPTITPEIERNCEAFGKQYGK